MNKFIKAAKRQKSLPHDDVRIRRNWDVIIKRLENSKNKSRLLIPGYTYIAGITTIMLILIALFSIKQKNNINSTDLNYFSNYEYLKNSDTIRISKSKQFKNNNKPELIRQKISSGEYTSVITMPDGSSAETSPAASVHLMLNTPEKIVLIQKKGKVKYTVTKNKHRIFSVKALGVKISVLGTKFIVNISENKTVYIKVNEGTVKAEDKSRQVILRTGESITFNSFFVPDIKNQKSKKYKTEKKQSLKNSLKQMLKKVDIARKSGNITKAVALLKKIVAMPNSDTDKITACFILAKLEFSLSEYCASAKYYKMYLNSAPSGTFAMDALAGQARSLFLCGKKRQAKKLAKYYLKKYPDSLHSERMKKLLR